MRRCVLAVFLVGCISEPAVIDGGKTDASADALASDALVKDAPMEAALMCGMTPSLAMGCPMTPCIASGMVTCVSSPQACGGKRVACAGKSMCTSSESCCLDISIMMPSSTCPDTYALGTNASVTSCVPSCPGHEVCASDQDCTQQNPHCHPAQFQGTTVHFGVCGP